jgi:hypothetical protein
MTRSDKEEFRVAIASNLASFFMTKFDASYSVERQGFNPDISGVIYAIWHGCQFCLLGIKPRKNLNILISQSNDGEIVARLAKNLGFSSIRGSMGRGGSQAVREILKTLKNGGNIAYTVDGPKGPACIVKQGIIKIAEMSGKPIIPLWGEASWAFQAKSWDSYKVPYPFARLKLYFGEAIFVPKNISDETAEQYRQKLEDEIFRLA